MREGRHAKPVELEIAPSMPSAVTFGVSEGKIAPMLLSYTPRDASTRLLRLP